MKVLARGRPGSVFALVAAMVASMAGVPPGVLMAAECGSSGNTYWTFNGVAPLEHAAVGDLGIYVVAGTKLSLLDAVTGAEINSRDFAPFAPGRPIIFTLRNPVNGASREVVVAGTDGIVYGLHPGTLANNWTRSTRRSTCTSDYISAPPVVQLWESSDASFRAARTTDVVMVGTHYQCGTTTGNKVYGLNAETGATVWVYNLTGTTFSVDAVHGLAVDYSRNTVYVTSDKADPSTSQPTCRGLNTITGVQRWAQDFGAIGTEPVMAAGRLYVTTRAGTLASIDPANGTSLWSEVVVSAGIHINQRLVADASSLSHVALYIVDSSGKIHCYMDWCTSHGVIWSYKPTGVAFTTSPAVLWQSASVYVGADDGRVYQFHTLDGSGQAYATISDGAASFGPLIAVEGTTALRPRLLARAGATLKKLCIPWATDLGDRAFRLDPEPPSTFMGVRISVPSFARDRRAPSTVARAGS